MAGGAKIREMNPEPEKKNSHMTGFFFFFFFSFEFLKLSASFEKFIGNRTYFFIFRLELTMENLEKIRNLGKGSFGNVHLVRDTRSNEVLSYFYRAN